MKSRNVENHSQLVMKNKTQTGRKSPRLIHCIPKFSQVMPTNQMTMARRALQNKIKSKRASLHNMDNVTKSDNKLRTINTTNQDQILNLFPELTIELVRNEESRKKINPDFLVPDVTIIPKYPHFTTEEKLMSSTVNNHSVQKDKLKNKVILNREEYEALLPTNPVYSLYIFLPDLNVFVHPLAVPPNMILDSRKEC